MVINRRGADSNSSVGSTKRVKTNKEPEGTGGRGARAAPISYLPALLNRTRGDVIAVFVTDTA
jgi:hypothetical protein